MFRDWIVRAWWARLGSVDQSQRECHLRGKTGLKGALEFKSQCSKVHSTLDLGCTGIRGPQSVLVAVVCEAMGWWPVSLEQDLACGCGNRIKNPPCKRGLGEMKPHFLDTGKCAGFMRGAAQQCKLANPAV